MKSDEGFLNNVDKQMLIQLVNENVIRFHCENTLKTYTKQIQNPRNESFGGFLSIQLLKQFIQVIRFLNFVCVFNDIEPIIFNQIHKKSWFLA